MVKSVILALEMSLQVSGQVDSGRVDSRVLVCRAWTIRGGTGST